MRDGKALPTAVRRGVNGRNRMVADTDESRFATGHGLIQDLNACVIGDGFYVQLGYLGDAEVLNDGLRSLGGRHSSRPLPASSKRFNCE